MQGLNRVMLNHSFGGSGFVVACKYHQINESNFINFLSKTN